MRLAVWRTAGAVADVAAPNFPAPARGPALLALLALLAALAVPAGCATRGQMDATASVPTPDAGASEATVRYFEAVRHRPPLLAAFLRDLPKGGDLHSHLSGAIYAETMLAWAAEDGVCIDVERLAALGADPHTGGCTAGGSLVPAAQAVADAELHGRLVDAWSVRNWHPADGPGHRRFFGAFGRFRDAVVDTRVDDMLADIAARAADGRVSYLEPMYSPDRGGARRLAHGIAWDPDLEALHAQLRSAGLDALVEEAVAQVDAAMAGQRQLLGCNGPAPSPGCEVVLRFQYGVGRAREPVEVFAGLSVGFALASRDPRFVAINLVQPEDHPRALQDYALHMSMVRFLAQRHPQVGITLHAGELTPGLVAPAQLRSHIRQAVEVAGARRIGHGVSVLHEDQPHALLGEMAARGVLVEVALSSNDIILGVRGDEHPLSVLLERGVPVALVTDDEGVARSSLPQEFQRAVQDHGLDYLQLKQLVRNSLEHAFVEGISLWRDARRSIPLDDCTEAAGGLQSAACDAAIGDSTRAGLQRRLELQLRAFERAHAAP